MTAQNVRSRPTTIAAPVGMSNSDAATLRRACIEIDAVLMEVLTRVQSLEIAGIPPRLSSKFISGPAHLPVQFKPARRS